MVTTSPAGGPNKWVLVPSNSLKSAGHKVYSESIQCSEPAKLQKEQKAPYNNAKFSPNDFCTILQDFWRYTIALCKKLTLM